MRSVIVEVTAEERPLLPGMVFDRYRFEMQAVTGALMTKDTADLAARFDNVADGSYIVTVLAISAEGQFIEQPVSAPLVVGGAVGVPQTYMAPVGLGFLVL